MKQQTIKIKLFSVLQDFLPPNHKGHYFEIQYQEGIYIADIIRQHDIPVQQVGIIVLNGEKICTQQIQTRQLQGGDELSFFPPLAGG